MSTNIQLWKLLLLGLLIITGHNLWAQESKTPPTKETIQKKVAEKVNINTAESEQLETLPRVGPVIAKRIIEFREQHQGFKKIEELMNVRGIGPKTFEKLAPLIEI